MAAEQKLKVKHLTNSLGNIAQWCLKLREVLGELDPEQAFDSSTVAYRGGGTVKPLGIWCPPALPGGGDDWPGGGRCHRCSCHPDCDCECHRGRGPIETPAHGEGRGPRVRRKTKAPRHR